MEPPPRVAFPLPDSSLLENGNTGIPGVTSFDSGRPGPHLVISALVHGNEVAGVAALARLDSRGIRPQRGRLTLILANLAAFRRFDPDHPMAARFLDEDLNRVWGPEPLGGAGDSYERRRARELCPVIARADALLDLHSMQNSGPPLLLCGSSRRGLALAHRLDWPDWIIADTGHVAGMRLVDHHLFTASPGGRAPGDEHLPAAVLVECGRHWEAVTVDTAWAAVLGFLAAFDAIDAAVAADARDGAAAAGAWPRVPRRVVRITEAITAESDSFVFPANDLPSVSVLPRKGSLVGFDNGLTVRTAYDDCVLVMPARKVRRGQTAVRLGRIISGSPP